VQTMMTKKMYQQSNFSNYEEDAAFILFRRSMTKEEPVNDSHRHILCEAICVMEVA